MAITRAQVANISELAAWMQANAVPSIFKSVIYANSILTATDADDNVVLSIKGAQNGSDYLRAYRAENNYLEIAFAEFPNHSNTIEVIGCDNGFIIDCIVYYTSNYYSRQFCALFTKTNNEKVAIIFPSTLSATASSSYTTTLRHVAFGESATMSTTTTFTPESGQQTSLTAWKTNPDPGVVSYTPKAFYLDMHSGYSSGIGKFVLNGEEYITNGYWAISCSTV